MWGAKVRVDDFLSKHKNEKAGINSCSSPILNLN